MINRYIKIVSYSFYHKAIIIIKLTKFFIKEILYKRNILNRTISDNR